MPASPEQRHARDRLFEDRFEMVEILGQLVETEILRDAVHAPGLGDRLEGAEQHLAGILLVIGAFVRHAQDRQGAEVRDRLGHDVEMLAGVERDRHAAHRTQFARPHAGAVDHDVGGDLAPFRFVFAVALPRHAGDTAVRLRNAGNLYAFGQQGAVLAGALASASAMFAGSHWPSSGR